MSLIAVIGALVGIGPFVWRRALAADFAAMFSPASQASARGEEFARLLFQSLLAAANNSSAKDYGHNLPYDLLRQYFAPAFIAMRTFFGNQLRVAQNETDLTPTQVSS